MWRSDACLGASLMLLSWACNEAAPPAPQLQASQHPVVYGEDTRQDVYAHPDEALRELTRRAIVSEVGLDSIDRSDPDGFVLDGRVLGESRNLCEGERFVEQIRVGSCSGTLVGPQTVLTAGHCIDADECPERAYVFDRFYRAEGVLETVTAEDVYPCRRVLVRSDGREDYAFVELDRPVAGDRAPAPIRVVEPLVVGTPLTLIGFPNGIPAKIDTGGRVIIEGEAPWVRFEATVDAFSGNSGSGVFDVDGALVAILAGGRTDYVDQGECRVVNRLAEDVDDAESLVYVGRAMDALCAAEPFHWLCEPAFEGGSWCEACEDAADCREGWICDGTCRPPCAGDAECRSDHRCVGGACVPHTVSECRANAVWAIPGCEAVRLDQDCGPDQVCAAGECVDPSPGDRCENALEIAAEDAVIDGQTADGFTNAYEGECGGEWPEVVYTFTLDEGARLTAGATGFDTLLYLRRDCDEEIACNDDRERGDEEARIEAELEPGTWHLFVDGYDESGAYTLELDFQFASECGVCEVGERRCTADGLSVCAASDDCVRWTEPVPCAPARRCEAGACVAAPAGDACAVPIPLAVEDAVVQEGPSDHAQTITGECGGTGPDRIYRIETDQPTRLQALLSGDEPVLYLREDCATQTDVACSVGGEGSAVLDEVLPIGVRFLVVDTNAATAGPFQLILDFECVDCPDGGVVDAGVDARVEDAGVVDAVVDAAPEVDMAVRDAARPVDAVVDGRVEDAEVDDAALPAALVDGSGGGCSIRANQRPSWAAWALLIGCLRRRRRG